MVTWFSNCIKLLMLERSGSEDGFFIHSQPQLLDMWLVWAQPVHTQKSRVRKMHRRAGVMEGASQTVINTQPTIAGHVTSGRCLTPSTIATSSGQRPPKCQPDVTHLALKGQIAKRATPTPTSLSDCQKPITKVLVCYCFVF
ncbi:hypothetical protein Hdeb2414_s0011g00361691 [Helianthus debilis subsp. tardiflorus]